MSQAKKFTLGLIPKIIVAIILGILVGTYLPHWVTRIAVTFSTIFGSFLNFVIPLMILAFVSKGIADLGEGAGRLLGITAGLAYLSTLIGGSLSYTMANALFPHFISADQVQQVTGAGGKALKPFFEIPLNPMIEVTGALVFAFVLGISISWMRKQGKGDTMYHLIGEFNEIIVKVLSTAIVPVLPFFIFGNFANMAVAGTVGAIMSIFLKIFLCIIALHLIYTFVLFLVASIYNKGSIVERLKNQVPGYLTAVGTQSSAATIPVNVGIAEKNKVSRVIREFVVPLGATVHMPGSMITITACTFTILTLFGYDHGFLLMFRYIAILGIAMVAAPGAPGGAVMSALPFLYVVGLASDGPEASLLISLYLAQDSFGTACNISGDNALALIVDKIYFTKILKRKKTAEDL